LVPFHLFKSYGLLISQPLQITGIVCEIQSTGWFSLFNIINSNDYYQFMGNAGAAILWRTIFDKL
jgi:hypothetical protein